MMPELNSQTKKLENSIEKELKAISMNMPPKIDCEDEFKKTCEKIGIKILTVAHENNFTLDESLDMFHRFINEYDTLKINDR